jgi:hypothetical protein
MAMLFHVTITHSQQDCPGRRPGETPALSGPPDRLEALGAELSVTSHSVVWAASCMLWAEPEHVAYALLEAAGLEAVERYVDALTPAGWATRVLPVFTLPGQVDAVRQLLAAPAIAVAEPPAAVTETADERDSADTLDGWTAAGTEPAEEGPSTVELPAAVVPPPAEPEPEPIVEPVAQRVTREVPLPVAEEKPSAAVTVVQPAVPQAGAVTRFIERPAMLDALVGAPPEPDQPEPSPAAVAANEPYSPSESSTVILEPAAQRLAGLRLVASAGPAQGTVFEVGPVGATLGRLPENSICLTDGRLSRHHARIEFREGGYWLSDLGSQNGTVVNDRPLTEAHRLQAGDSIELGTSRLTVMLDPDD